MPHAITNNFQTSILTWFDHHGRKNLPWQINKTPYRVWISEIMLQQTQVATVIPYYQNFMSRFPTLASLAAGSLEEVLYLWTGLGYYSRARNLHRAAVMIQEKFHGVFPNELTELMQLPGIGRSTAGAILSLAYNKPIAILDGNVKRVLSRFACITAPIESKKTEDTLWQLAERYMAQQRCADFTQAMMDLGATICTRSKPRCTQCPLQQPCLAFNNNLTDQIPMKKTKRGLPVHTATLLLIRSGYHILLEKRHATGIWGGLWSLPQLEGKANVDEIKNFCRKHFQLSVKDPTPLPHFKHTFSHYHLNVHPISVLTSKRVSKAMEDEVQIWYNLQNPNQIGLPRPVKQLLEGLANEIHSLPETE